jgi:hypothetical protein
MKLPQNCSALWGKYPLGLLPSRLVPNMQLASSVMYSSYQQAPHTLHEAASGGRRWPLGPLHYVALLVPPITAMLREDTTSCLHMIMITSAVTSVVARSCADRRTNDILLLSPTSPRRHFNKLIAEAWLFVRILDFG